MAGTVPLRYWDDISNSFHEPAFFTIRIRTIQRLSGDVDRVKGAVAAMAQDLFRVQHGLTTSAENMHIRLYTQFPKVMSILEEFLHPCRVVASSPHINVEEALALGGVFQYYGAY